MQLLARALGSNGKRVGSQITGAGKKLGGALGAHRGQHKRHPTGDHKTPTSGLERGSARGPTGNIHHIPRDGQFSITHSGPPERAPWQRKKNH